MFPFFGQYARALKLFHYIPKELTRNGRRQHFDIDVAFQKIAKISVTDFIDVGYGSFAVATSKGAFTGGWFQKARSQGMKFDDDVVRKGLDQLAADQWQLRELDERTSNPTADMACTTSIHYLHIRWCGLGRNERTQLLTTIA
jgi:hypothetical protein